jgi:hypothetical protein
MDDDIPAEIPDIKRNKSIEYFISEIFIYLGR